jgi:hypothetical protein
LKPLANPLRSAVVAESALRRTHNKFLANRAKIRSWAANAFAVVLWSMMRLCRSMVVNGMSGFH